MNIRICALLAVGLFATACQDVHGQGIRIEGPAAGRALSETTRADFQREKKGALAISVAVNGSGAALRKLCRNEVEAATASRPILKDELARCQAAGVEFIELPVAFDALVVVVNARNTFVTDLTVEQLGRLWGEGKRKIDRWSELEAGWPDRPVKHYGLDAQAEGTSYFYEAILRPPQAARYDYHPSVDEVVLVRAVERDPLALSYVSLSTYFEHQAKLKAVAIAHKGGMGAVMPTLETVAQGTYRPLARPLFLYVRVKALQSAATREFFEHWVQNGERLAREARLVPLSPAGYQAGLARLQRLATGSVWGGKIAVGATLQEVEKKHPPL